MRQIVLDTETTGLSPDHGHRIVEIGCLELLDRRFTGQQFHQYVNPERELDEGAVAVHGITMDFLQDKPLFRDVSDQLLAFIDGAELIIHNAPFDLGFLNAEFSRLQYSKTIEEHCRVIDTLVLAKQKHPGQKNNLDALCKRYNINNMNRTLHGALIDAELLALVYLAMTGGQIDLFADPGQNSHKKHEKNLINQSLISNSPVIYATEEEIKKHDDFLVEISQ